MGENVITTIQKKLQVVNKLGLHVRASKRLVDLLQSLPVDVYLSGNQEQWENGKSIMAIMGLGASQGDVVTVKVQAESKAWCLDAMSEIEQLFAKRFGDSE